MGARQASPIPDLIRPRILLRECELFVDGKLVRRFDGPIAALHWLAKSWSELALDPRERWVGYLGYDVGRLFERLPERRADHGRTPLFAFGMGSSPIAEPAASLHGRSELLRSTLPRTQFLHAVRTVIDYIRAGDVFQVNLAQVLTVRTGMSAWQVCQSLRRDNPGVYDAYLDFGDFQIISNSPELFVRVGSDSRIITRPIKGTRPAGPGMEAELRESAKDHAELAMIVDLERNDLGRICQTGSVRVTEPRAIEAHPTLFHGVATIEGQLREGVGLVDVLRATFPSGSVTGAPKIRAMQIIDELEPVGRGVYCGSIGTISADSSMEFNVAIRTMVIRDGFAFLPVGGGIVADSNPQAEYDETIVKARAMLCALGIESVPQ